MKKLLCVMLFLVNSVVHSALWDENTTTDEKFKDCIEAITKDDIKFFKDNGKEIKNNLEYFFFCYNENFRNDHLYEGESLITIAIAEKRNKIVKILIKAGMDVNFYGATHVLWYAIENNDTEMIDFLLKYGANPYLETDINCYKRVSSLAFAIQKKDKKTIKKFLEAVKKENFEKSRPNLSSFLMSNQEKIALFLIQSDEDGELSNKIFDDSDNLCTYLQLAYGFENYEAAEALINKGIDLNFKNNKGQTVLHDNAKYNHASLVNKLIEHGANPAIKNEDGKLAEDLTTDENIKLILKNARTIQTLCSDFSKLKKNEKKVILSLIQSFSLLSFTMYQMKSYNNFVKFYNWANDESEDQKNPIAHIMNFFDLDKDRSLSSTILDLMLGKDSLRLKAHFYNTSLISKSDYIEKFGEKEFEKMLITADRIKKR